MTSPRRTPLARAPWPGAEWPEAAPDPAVDVGELHGALATLLAQRPEHGETHAVVVAHRGAIVAEGYGPGHGPAGEQLSWSLAKSVTHALTGLVVGDGLLDVEAPAPVPEWAGDARAAITVQHLLTMRDGLDFNEEYEDIGISHVVDMLFFSGKDDVGGYAAARPLRHTPGEVWNYSSGTTHVLTRLLADVSRAPGEPRAAATARLLDRLFRPLGMTSARPEIDAAGTFVGAALLYATPRDFARFGHLYLRDGVWDGERLLPEGWVRHAGAQSAVDPDTGYGYGAHWRLWPSHPGLLAAHGHEGQYLLVDPSRDLVVVRFGRTAAALRPNVVGQLRRIVDAFPAGAGD